MCEGLGRPGRPISPASEPIEMGRTSNPLSIVVDRTNDIEVVALTYRKFFRSSYESSAIINRNVKSTISRHSVLAAVQAAVKVAVQMAGSWPARSCWNSS